MDGDGFLTIEESAARLGVHYMTVYRYVRLGRLPAERRGGRWRIDSRPVERMAAGGQRRPRRAPDPPDRVGRLLSRLVEGDAPGSWSIVEAALAAGAPARVYTDLLGPALRELGEGWAAGRFSVADEHRATAVALGIVGQMGPLFRRRGRHRPGQTLLAGVEGDAHTIPLTMVADTLIAGGFEVIHLGANLPTAELVAAAAGKPQLRAVGLSASTDTSAERAGEAIAALRGRLGAVPVVLGGPAVSDERYARKLGADAWAGDAAGAVEVISGLGTRR
jgi:excisionase family DNA binding protein